MDAHKAGITGLVLAGVVLALMVGKVGADAVLLAGVVDVDEVGMVDRGGQPGLAHEPLAELLVAGQRRGDDLHRYSPAKRDLGRFPDHSHAAGGCFPFEATAAENVTGPWRPRSAHRCWLGGRIAGLRRR